MSRKLLIVGKRGNGSCILLTKSPERGGHGPGVPTAYYDVALAHLVSYSHFPRFPCDGCPSVLASSSRLSIDWWSKWELVVIDVADSNREWYHLTRLSLIRASPN